jgi:hypothetical protein
MARTLFATAAFVALIALAPQGASAQMQLGAGPSAPSKRCDADGCWTYRCDANSTHCHRHWISSTPRDATAPADTAHGDEVCDRSGDNCSTDTPH